MKWYKWHEWIIIIVLIIIISIIVNEIKTPYIGNVQFNNADFYCDGCISAKIYDDYRNSDGTKDEIYSTIIIVPNEYHKVVAKRYLNGSLEEQSRDCFIPEFQSCKYI